ncbi:phosphatidate cytidylyltransferase [Avrilella dinanensis]|uniref:phosphatidate cytidylyltransferase n=1 Tax=Avrilella dinanensis TaxID=2008672 RepID=UPI00240A8AEE|nr:phosphatidate cytidylyltransferase [Avrilella dinanensis]
MNESVVRSLSGIVYIALIVFAALLGRESYQLFFVLLLFVAVNEFSGLVDISKVPAFLYTGLLVTSAYLLNHSNLLHYIILLSVPFLIYLAYLLFRNKAFNINGWLTLTGYILLPFIAITQYPFVSNDYNPYMVLAVFILIWTNDTFAYIFGKSFGKHKLYEKVSPKKTIEGFLGGLLFCVIAGVIIAQYIDTFAWYQWIIVALIVSVFSTIGDLVESKFKREAGVKDSGNLIPGHGGILDRLDSFIFTLPFLFLFKVILNYVSVS